MKTLTKRLTVLVLAAALAVSVLFVPVSAAGVKYNAAFRNKLKAGLFNYQYCRQISKYKENGTWTKSFVEEVDFFNRIIKMTDYYEGTATESYTKIDDGWHQFFNADENMWEGWYMNSDASDYASYTSSYDYIKMQINSLPSGTKGKVSGDKVTFTQPFTDEIGSGTMTYVFKKTASGYVLSYVKMKFDDQPTVWRWSYTYKKKKTFVLPGVG